MTKRYCTFSRCVAQTACRAGQVLVNSEGVLRVRQVGEASVEIDPSKSKCRGDLEVCCKETVRHDQVAKFLLFR